MKEKKRHSRKSSREGHRLTTRLCVEAWATSFQEITCHRRDATISPCREAEEESEEGKD